MIKRIAIVIGVIVLLFMGSKVFGDEQLDACESLLRWYEKAHQEDNQIIHDLENIIDGLELRVATLEQENADLNILLNRQTGWYIGATSGYPFPQFTFIGMYKFNRWGFVMQTGYINGFTINGGFMIRFHE